MSAVFKQGQYTLTYFVKTKCLNSCLVKVERTVFLHNRRFHSVLFNAAICMCLLMPINTFEKHACMKHKYCKLLIIIFEFGKNPLSCDCWAWDSLLIEYKLGSEAIWQYWDVSNGAVQRVGCGAQWRSEGQAISISVLCPSRPFSLHWQMSLCTVCRHPTVTNGLWLINNYEHFYISCCSYSIGVFRVQLCSSPVQKWCLQAWQS